MLDFALLTLTHIQFYDTYIKGEIFSICTLFKVIQLINL